ncbi:MAG: hypothetical protein K0R65_1709 [Crocinitomicaceae bacterium]|jgi:predicted nuclease of predicted toxin-antitoxin system|nr:hypothetical protein [Crocinitomicaceae bacterium]
MKLLFDQNISFRITKKLPSSFKECKHVSDVGLLNAEDPKIWEFSRKNDFTIVTFDSDFYDISLIEGQPPKIIWLKTGNMTSNGLVKLLVKYEKEILDFIEKEEYTEISCLELDNF